MKPQQESVYFLLNDKNEPVALIRNKVMFSVDPLSDDGIARLFNGGDHLPLVQGALRKDHPSYLLPEHDDNYGNFKEALDTWDKAVEESNANEGALRKDI